MSVSKKCPECGMEQQMVHTLPIGYITYSCGTICEPVAGEIFSRGVECRLIIIERRLEKIIQMLSDKVK